MNLYLAGPIDLVGLDGQTWKKLLANKLESVESPAGQWTTFDPAAPYGLVGSVIHTPPRCRYIEAVNTAALHESDAIVAYVSSTKASVGTPIELEQAANTNKSSMLKEQLSSSRSVSRNKSGIQIFIITDIQWGKSVYLANRVRAREFYIDRKVDDKTKEIEAVDAWLTRAAYDIGDLITNNRDAEKYDVTPLRRSHRDTLTVLPEIGDETAMAPASGSGHFRSGMLGPSLSKGV